MREWESRRGLWLACTPSSACRCPRVVGSGTATDFGKATPERAVVDSAEALCMALLDKYKVALVPGEAFGADNTIRLSYAATRENIRDAVTKLAKFLGELKQGTGPLCIARAPIRAKSPMSVPRS